MCGGGGDAGAVLVGVVESPFAWLRSRALGQVEGIAGTAIAEAVRCGGQDLALDGHC